VSRLDARVIVVLGALVVVVALAVAAVLDQRDTSPTGSIASPPVVVATASPAPTAPSVPASVPPDASTNPSVPAATTGPASTPDPFTRVLAFFSELVPATHEADLDAEALVALLHPATIERYGQAACVDALARTVDPTFDVVVHGVGSPAPWDYVTDGLTTTIPDALAVDASVTSNGATDVRTLRVALVDGEVRGFADCGTPIASSPAP
jgi:hypothetical protein